MCFQVECPGLLGEELWSEVLMKRSQGTIYRRGRDLLELTEHKWLKFGCEDGVIDESYDSLQNAIKNVKCIGDIVCQTWRKYLRFWEIWEL